MYYVVRVIFRINSKKCHEPYYRLVSVVEMVCVVCDTGANVQVLLQFPSSSAYLDIVLKLRNCWCVFLIQITIHQMKTLCKEMREQLSKLFH
jgi:hypothetical protein